jgi:Tfp pilus assembly protein PilX
MAKRPAQHPSGISSVLAMLYLVLFSTLAVGFFAAITTATQIAANEQRSARARLAAESGMAFMRYHLATAGLPARTPPDQLFDALATSLHTKFDNTQNMPTGSATISVSSDGDTITIPGDGTSRIALDAEGSSFRAVIHKLMNGETIQVIVYGNYANSSFERAISLQYANFPSPASIFNYGVASRGKISMTGNVAIKGSTGNEYMGSVLSSWMDDPVALSMIGNSKISGHVSFVNPDASPNISTNSTIAGLHTDDAGFDDVVHKGIEPPEFPVVDNSLFEQYVPGPNDTGPSVITGNKSGNLTLKNLRIKAGANPTFSGNIKIQGVMYIESPNKVKFTGNTTIQGVIVAETDDNNNESLNLSQNQVNFAGNVNFSDVSTLPDTSEFPPSLHELTGGMLLVPGYGVTFTGNFSTIAGSIIGSQFTFTGNAGGLVKGSIINLGATPMALTGNSNITIESQGTSNYPPAIRFGSAYSPLPYTYSEGGS